MGEIGKAGSGKLSGWKDRPLAALWLIALVASAWLAFTPMIFNDGDTSWHLATGRWILDHRAIPHSDPFSFTALGQPWTAHEWAVELLMALADSAAGWAGIALLFSLAISLTLVLMGRELVRWLPWQRAAALLALLIAVLAPAMLARPHVVGWALLTIWTTGLLKARGRGGAPWLPLALLMIVWANSHASFIFGLFLAGVFGLEALIAGPDRARIALRWALFGVAALACSLLTPHGFQGLLYPLQVSGMDALPLIHEWRPTSLRKDWLFVLFAVLVAVLAVVRRHQLSFVRFLLLGLLAELAFLHARHQAIFAIVALLILSRPATPGGEEGKPTRSLKLALLAGVLLVAAARLAIPIERGDGPNYPASAIASLPVELRQAPLLNSYSFGGPLILHGIAPFIDGRADMYGDALTIEHYRIVEGDRAALDRAVRRWDLRWTILDPDEPLAAILDRDPEWRRHYTDRHAVIHVRP